MPAAQASLDRLYLAVGGRAACCSPTATAYRSTAAAPSPTTHLPPLGPLDRHRLERGGRGHQRHRHMPGRAAGADHPPRPALLHPQHGLSCTTAPIYDHDGTARGGARRLVLPRRPYRRLPRADRHRGRDAARRIEAETFRLAFPGPDPARVGPRPRPGPDRRRPRRPGDRRDQAARLALGITLEAPRRPAPVTDLIGGRDGELDPAERGGLQRALAAPTATSRRRRGARHQPRHPLPQAQAPRPRRAAMSACRRCRRSATVRRHRPAAPG